MRFKQFSGSLSTPFKPSFTKWAARRLIEASTVAGSRISVSPLLRPPTGLKLMYLLSGIGSRIDICCSNLKRSSSNLLMSVGEGCPAPAATCVFWLLDAPVAGAFEGPGVVGVFGSIWFNFGVRLSAVLFCVLYFVCSWALRMMKAGRKRLQVGRRLNKSTRTIGHVGNVGTLKRGQGLGTCSTWLTQSVFYGQGRLTMVHTRCNRIKRKKLWSYFTLAYYSQLDSSGMSPDSPRGLSSGTVPNGLSLRK